MTKLNNNRYFAIATAVAIAIVFTTSIVLVAQVKKGKSRLLTTSQLMKGIIKPHCGKVKETLDAGVKDDKGWEELGVNAALLNEASYTLMDDGRCPDGVWMKAATETLRQGSTDLLKAIEAKDSAAAKTAFGSLSKACKECHDKHKEKK